MSMNQTLANLSPAAKLGLAAGGGAGVVGMIAALLTSPALAGTLGVGLLVVVLALVIYKLVLKWLDKRKASPMLKALSGNSAAAPKGVSDPARRARLDDLRRVFDVGMEKFRDAGKNIYSVPWYILVGEPGSGKTEAIRHCNVGFPPGLQDELQGVGGTINMNWWFTNHAVILDTAGRLMFEEVEPGTTSEWQEFLKLLRRNRPNCPINGLLLVVPAESLIRDNADTIAKKGGKIAQQLDQIQRLLGVRFPVYLVVTKCDLINGFREFFDELSDPALQHQMLGWSNPAPLDAPFSAELVDQHLKSVHGRLVRRRLGLLLDPVNTEDGSKRRTDQVDALFAFPDSLLKIGPRLRRYLEMIFVAGEWSARPLFLRGIYLTSSMREGGALDAELADVFGIAIESLPEGRVWERERAFFLRDLFMNKIFRERGLVTRASNTSKQQSRRRLTVYGSAAVGGTLVLAFTLLGWLGLSARVVEPVRFWSSVAEAYSPPDADLLPVIGGSEGGWNYIGGREVPGVTGVAATGAREEGGGGWGGLEPQRGTVPLMVADAAKKQIRIPGVFRLIAAVLGDPASDLSVDQRKRAAAAIYQGAVLRPMVESALARMRSDAPSASPAAGGGWNAEASEALVQLLRVEVGRVEGNPDPRVVELQPLARYVLGEGALGKDPAEQLPKLEAMSRDWLYAKPPPPGQGGQPFEVGTTGRGGLADGPKVVADGMKRLAEAWAGGGGLGGGGGSSLLADVEQSAVRFAALSEAEKQLQATTTLKDWRARLAAVREAAKAAGEAKERLQGKTLAGAYDEASAQVQADGGRLMQRLRDEVIGRVIADPAGKKALSRPSSGGGAGKDDESRWEQLEAACKSIDALAGTLAGMKDRAQQRRAELAALDSLHLQTVADPPLPAFLTRLAMYDVGDKLVSPGPVGAPSTFTIGIVGKKLADLDQLVQDSRKQVDSAKALFGDDKQLTVPVKERLDGAVTVSRFAIQAGWSEQAAGLVQQWASALPADPKEVQAAVERFARENSAPVPKAPELPLTRWQEAGASGGFEAKFNPTAGAAFLLDCQQVLRRNPVSAAAPAPDPLAPDTGGDLKPAERQKVQQACIGYATSYLDYWTTEVRASTAFAASGWKAAVERLRAVPQTVRFDEQLTAICAAIDAALAAVEPVAPRELPVKLSPAELRTQAKAARESIAAGSKSFSDALASWRRMSGDPLVDRDTVVAERSFGDSYVPALTPERPEQALGDIASAYRLGITLGLLDALADDYLGAVRGAAAQLQASEKFPLVAPARTGGRVTAIVEQISAADVGVLRDRLRGLLAQPTGPGAGAGGGAVGRTGAPWEADLARLRDPLGELALDRARLNSMLSILRELPTATEPARTCSISVVDAAAEGEQLASFYYPVVAIVQAEVPQAPAAGSNFRGGRSPPVTIRWPGQPVSIYFYQFGAGDAPILERKQTIEAPGAWAALLLLFQGKDARATRVQGSDKAWDVKVEMLVDQQPCFVTLRLELGAVFPEPGSWPKRP